MPRRDLRDLAADPHLREVLTTNSRLGLRVQVLIRFVLVAFAVCAAALLPPARHQGVFAVAVAAYAVLGLAANVWLLAGRDAAVSRGWSALLLDVVALGLLTVIAGQAAVESWTADLMITGLVVIPLLAATQLRPGVCLAVAIPTDVVYLAASLATRRANTEPLDSVLLRTLVLVALSGGCVALSAIQRARVMTIGSLVASRSGLLDDLLDLERRERQQLSEQLHDGALQYVLAARLDLDDVRDGTDAAALERIDDALQRTAQLLRSTVGELHPAVLQQVGLPGALQDVAAMAAERGGFQVRIDDGGWPAGRRTPVDGLLFGTARELLANVVKHASARRVVVTVAHDGARATLAVRDDGVGFPPGELERKLADGHIGVASHRARIDAAGGALTYAPTPAGGTTATVVVPAPSV